MKTKAIMAALMLLAFSMTESAAQRYEGVVDKTVAIVGNSVILLSDVEAQALARQSYGLSSDRCSTLEEMLVVKLLYTQAVLDSLAVNQDMLNASLSERVDYELSMHGGEEGVEQYYGKPLHVLRNEWRNDMMEQNLAGEMRRNIAGKIGEVTPREVEQYYKRIPKDSLPVIPTKYQFSQIVIYPNVERAEMEVRERLLEFRQRVIDGEKFSLLATLYSEDNSAMRGGELGMTSKSFFWPEFSDAAMSLKPGQVSPIVQTPDGFHLIQLIERKGDMFNARHILLKPRYTREDRDSAFLRLDSIRNVILTDSITFEQAAKKYSEDPKTRTNGGLVSDPMTGAPFFAVDELKANEYEVLRNMKEGDVSGPIESTDNEGRNGNTVYKILRLDKVRPAHTATYNDDFDVLLDHATNQKAMDAIEQFIQDKQQTTYIVIDPIFQKCVFQREGWLK